MVRLNLTLSIILSNMWAAHNIAIVDIYALSICSGYGKCKQQRYHTNIYTVI